ncbi:MAG: BolA family protein [Porticoccaceae bacterium]|jgi:stress-induced morphogen|nr:BolA family protein [Porticoccaceae bacterium]|tara:strand:- start:93 stop:410 length:318 start_codon:yes stop_codon:yes gene_type:complete
MKEPVKNKIVERLTEEFNPDFLEVINESSSHSVPLGSESHFKVILVSESFIGLNLVQRHRRVYSALSHEMENQIHALTMQTLAPKEWEDQGLKIHNSPVCLSEKV